MANDVIMPSLGFDMTQGKLSRWLVREGEPVKRGQVIAEIETDKASVELEAHDAGTLQKIVIPAGQTVPVNTVIAVIGTAVEEEGKEKGGRETWATEERRPEEVTRPEVPVDKSQQTGPKAGQGAPKPAPSGATAAAPAASTGAGPATAGTAEAGEERIKASPVARRMAQEAGINLRQVTGTGPGGRIMERDIQALSAGKQPAAPAPTSDTPTRVQPPAPVAPEKQPVAPTAKGPELSRIRQTIARRMTESKTTVPHFYVTVEVLMAQAMQLREQLNALGTEAEKISVNDLVVAAAARTLVKFPNFNASFQGDRLAMHAQVNIGIAVALEEGLLTPVLYEVDKKALRTIAAESRALAERARANKLRPEDLGPGTFTISNLGMFGVDEFAAIINPPEAAILAVGAVAKRPVVIGDEVRAAPTMKMTIAVDHRVADGAQGARFLQELKKLLENPMNLLLP